MGVLSLPATVPASICIHVYYRVWLYMVYSIIYVCEYYVYNMCGVCTLYYSGLLSCAQLI